MDEEIRLRRAIRVCRDTVIKFELDLSGLTVFTELATGNYAMTPLVASMAGAEKVFVYTEDSAHGKAEDIIGSFFSRMNGIGLSDELDRIVVVPDKLGDHLGECDIVTNLGHLRRIDRSMISRMKSTAVIPLMYETWEFRDNDLDLGACRDMGILVLGTNEVAPPLDMMRYGGFLMLKLMFECGMEAHMDRVLVIGDGRLARNIVNFLERNDISHHQIDPRIKNSFDLMDWDAVVIADLKGERTAIGSGGIIEATDIHSTNPLLQIIHICGRVNMLEIMALGLQIYPTSVRDLGYMSATADYLGPKATIELNTAGLKVGEIMARYRLKYDYQTTIERSVEHDMVDGWS